MIEADIAYIRKILNLGLIKSPCLELGAGHEDDNNRNLIEGAGIKYFATDMMAGKNIDFVVNFEDSLEVIKQKTYISEGFSSILVLNVLEHTFNPIKILDNVFSIIRPGGTCVIIAPAVWPLHNFPIDCWRINPNFYEQYCEAKNLVLIDEYFEYIGFDKVKNKVDEVGNYVLPRPSMNKTKTLISHVVHKLFNTYGRAMSFPPHIGIGAVIKK